MIEGLKVIFYTQYSAKRTRNKLEGPEEALSERSPEFWLGGIASLSYRRLVIKKFYFVCLLSSVKYFLVFYYRDVSILGFMNK